MKQKLLSLLAAAALFITAATTTQAEQIVVHKGDTLWDLSKQYKVSVESIKKWNNLSDDVIHPNDLLEISPIKHVLVRKGDNLWNISQVYGVSVEDVKKWNHLSSDIIQPNWNLIIYTNRQNDIKGKKETVKPNAQSVQHNPAPAETVDLKQADKEITVEATAYTAECEGCIGITKTGVDLKANPDEKVIAVDPSVIPLGSKVYVEGYGYATAEDIGGAIKGNRIDVFIPELDDALEWGRKQVNVTIID
ncbi:LysM peptidoglycan-binding domain-containing protein [Bacillus sp. V3B]|uniref:3D domain-containing protein n=1 Tax=Bacillus sp. V3B TaxID=2804915 RepID=UPI00210916F9|nr:LysM peptidoglycan-binding and 3D domain-containing protein [Bacillus sp. V3B]MCQ6277269.1 LysM peptidoglycan-binding domain-containing protein [Bacillus sp. V3B]